MMQVCLFNEQFSLVMLKLALRIFDSFLSWRVLANTKSSSDRKKSI
jgi:hypothetical protein